MPYTKKTHCKYGHPFEGNTRTIYRNGRPVRLCKLCIKSRRKLPPHVEPDVDIVYLKDHGWLDGPGVTLTRGFWDSVFNRVLLIKDNPQKWVAIDLHDIPLRPYQISDVVSAGRRRGLEVSVRIHNSKMYLKGVRIYAAGKYKSRHSN